MRIDSVTDVNDINVANDVIIYNQIIIFIIKLADDETKKMPNKRSMLNKLILFKLI